MSRTRAEFVSEFASALDVRPISLKKLHAISEQAFVDLRDVPPSNSKLDCPLASCCDDVRAVNACEKHLGVMTIRDLSRVGCDRLLEVRNLGRIGFVAIHDAASKELGDHLLSRDLDDDELQQILSHNLVLRSDLRGKKFSWLRWASPNLAEHLTSLRGMSGVEEDDQDGEDDLDGKEKPLSQEIQRYLERLNERSPTKELQDDDF